MAGFFLNERIWNQLQQNKMFLNLEHMLKRLLKESMQILYLREVHIGVASLLELGI